MAEAMPGNLENKLAFAKGLLLEWADAAEANDIEWLYQLTNKTRELYGDKKDRSDKR